MTDTVKSTLTLAEALPDEIKRVTAKKERWQRYNQEEPELAHGMSFGIAMMAAEIDRAVRACVSGDVAEMASCYQALKGYDDND